MLIRAEASAARTEADRLRQAGGVEQCSACTGCLTSFTTLLCGCTGDIVQYDISDPANPKLAGMNA